MVWGLRLEKYNGYTEPSDSVVIVTHESVQPRGYAMKDYIKDEGLDKKKSPAEFNSAMLDFGTNFYNYYGFCMAKGGEYLINNGDTKGYAVKGSEFLLKAYENGSGSVYNEGKHYCVGLPNTTEQFTVTVSKHPFNGVMRFQPLYGVDQSAIKPYSGQLPWYAGKTQAQAQVQAVVAPATQGYSALNGSYQPAEKELATQAIQARDTVISNQNGSEMEGMYIGRNAQMCELSAVMKVTNRPFGHKYLYGSNDNYPKIMNFKRCGGGDVEFVGESLERSFPKTIENDYKRVYTMCKLRGTSRSGNLGYNIDCKRVGEMTNPIYEMTIVKKDRLVLRALEQ